jgi:hypothetical protein
MATNAAAIVLLIISVLTSIEASAQIRGYLTASPSDVLSSLPYSYVGGSWLAQSQKLSGNVARNTLYSSNKPDWAAFETRERRNVRSRKRDLAGAGPQQQLLFSSQQQQRRLLDADSSIAGFNTSCWEGFPGFPASSGGDLRRLLEDPAANRIELQGNIIFDEENFPPPPPGSPCRGLNITHRVS